MEREHRDAARRSLTATYGEHRFGDRAMRERLPWSVYEELKRVQAGRLELSPQTAETVANAMKDWPSSTAPPITPTGSSPSPARPRKSTTPSSGPIPTAAPLWNFPAAS